jgi:predicted DNA-binding mobile mystery protein A
MKSTLRQRARQHLDSRLSRLKPEASFEMPPKGWVRAIRDALGMSGVQLAARLGVAPQTVEQIEKSEAGGTVQMNTLRRAAAALDCTLVYALVPRTSLENAVRSRARALALRDLDRVGHTMKLEAQGVDAAGLEGRIDDYIRDVLKDRDLWNEP